MSDLRVFMWNADEGGCRFYRCDVPARGLAARGHQVHVGGVMPDWWRDNADVIVGQRVCQPGATQRWQNLARAGRAKLVFEIDDDLFDIHPTNKAGHAFFSRPEIRSNLEANLRAADLVTVTTHDLAEKMSRFNRNVVVLPNCIPDPVLDLPPVPDSDRLTVGWGGSFTHAIDWRDHAEHIARAITRNPRLTLHVMGWTPPVLADRVPPERFRATGWIGSVDELHRALDFHIGVIPLRDMPFNHAKSDVKYVEMAARGIPVVASDVGPYRRSILDGVTGLLVKHTRDWGRWIKALADDPDRRALMGKNARAWAATRAISANAHLWEQAYQS